MPAKTKQGRRLEYNWLTERMKWEPRVGEIVRVHWRDSLHKKNKVHEGELLEVKATGLCIETKDQDEIFVLFMNIKALEKWERDPTGKKLKKKVEKATTPKDEAFAVPVEEAECPTCKGLGTIKAEDKIKEKLCPQCTGSKIIYV